MTQSQNRETRIGLLFVSPWIIGFTVFMLIPGALSFWFSFCD